MLNFLLCVLRLVLQELSLVGFMSCRWTGLIDKLMSFSYDLHPVQEQYFRVLTLLQEIPPTGKMMSEKVWNEFLLKSKIELYERSL